MKKRNKIIYWIATIWLALGMTSAGIVQLIKLQEEVEMMEVLGYPTYLLPLLKEWAYAGFFFNMLGALYSHLMMSGGAIEIFGPSLLIVLIIISWVFRPESRKLKLG